MNKVTSGICALVLVIGLAAACTDSKGDRIESKQGDNTPSTAQPATPPDTSGGASAANPGSSSGSGNRTN